VEQKSCNGIYYFVQGSGLTTVVLLRGLGRWSEHWLGFEGLLVSRGLRVITIDGRGFGKSRQTKISSKMTMVDLADDVAQVLTKESPAGAHLVGLSLGGMVAISLAAMNPQLVRSLMIVNSSVSASGMKRLTRRALVSIIKVICRTKYSYQALTEAVLSAHTTAAKKNAMAEAWSDIDGRHKIPLAQLWHQIIIARQFNGSMEMASLRCPVTVIRCAADRFVDPSNSDFIHRNIKGSQLISHPTAGHELAVDDPEWFANVIINFVSTPQNV